jgi:RimJ/RimL family protein N-acetyltransferase
MLGREQAPVGVMLTLEWEPGDTFDLAVWGQGYATEAAGCVRDCARDVLPLPYAFRRFSRRTPRSQRVAERSGARCEGQMDVVGLTWERWVWPLATGGEACPG